MRQFAVLIVIIACLAETRPAQASRIVIFPHPIEVPVVHRPVIRPMEVRELAVDIEIAQQVATVHSTARFFNPNGRRVEGTYYFPVGPDAAVSSFAMQVNGKNMEAELLDSDKARRIYEDIVRRQRDPALLEYDGFGLLKARVFPIEPHSEVKIELSYNEPVKRQSSLSRYRYPLVAARPGAHQAIQQLSVTAKIKGKQVLKSLFVPGYPCEIEKGGVHGTVTYKGRQIQPERDFEILFGESGDKVGLNALTYKKGDDGYFLLFATPDSELQAEEIANKELIFVMDTSGSMHGDNIRQTQASLRYCVDSLAEGDWFNVLSFATDVSMLFERAQVASADNKKQAHAYIDRMKARGGTAIDDALQAALAQIQPSKRVTMLVFLTDGLPTIGEVSTDVILQRLKAREQGARIFTFGVGYDVNTRLLNGLAARTGGYPTYIRPGENLELALSDFYERIAKPVLTNVKLEAPVKLEALNPRHLPDLFSGTELVVSGRYEGGGTKTFVLSGEVGDVREKFQVSVGLDGDHRNAFIPRVWAKARVAFLQEQIRQNGHKQELVEEIKRLGRRHGILTPYTSFLVVEEGLRQSEQVRAREEFRRMEEVARELDAVEGGERAVERSIALRGQVAVDASLSPPAASSKAKSIGVGGGISVPGDAGFLKKLDVSQSRYKEMVRHVGDKTFYLRQKDGYLYDSSITAGHFPDADIEVVLWSDAFFKLLREHPQLRLYLRAGERLVIEHDGKIIRITGP